MRIPPRILILVALVACTGDPSLAADEQAATVTCAALPSCPDADCAFAPGAAPDPTDGAGLWCKAIAVDNPCFCVPQGAGVDTWCTLTAAQIGGVNGTACSADTQCASGFCRDNVCCNSDCGGGGVNGNTGDCQACSVAHYGQANGTCSTITNTSYVCRLYGDPTCDLSERCDGSSTSCPADLGRNAGQICNTTTGATCPANNADGAPHVCPLI